MSYQSQTYSNNNSGYYIQSGPPNPIFPDDTVIQGPVQIAPEIPPGDPAANYYNRFTQSDAQGLLILELSTPTELLSAVNLDNVGQVSLNSLIPGKTAVLNVGNDDGFGLVSVNSAGGFLVNDSGSSGAGLNIYHDTATNNNVICNYQNLTGAQMVFEANSQDIRFTNSITNDMVQIGPQTNSLQVTTTDYGQTVLLANNSVQFEANGVSGQVGIAGGFNVTVDSGTTITLRVNTQSIPKITAMTALQNGNVTFYSTITSPNVNVSQSANIPLITSPNVNFSGNIITAVGQNITAGAGLFGQTGQVGTLTTTSAANPALNVTNGGTASIPALVNVASINSIPIAQFGNPVGTIISFPVWTPPTGYVRCDGSSYSTGAPYNTLFSVLGYQYGGSGGSFNVPNLLGKTMMGALAQYNTGGGAPTQISNYVANGVFQGLVTDVTNPITPISNGIWISSTDKPITQGMVYTGTGIISPSLTVAYVVGGDGYNFGDGLRGFLVQFFTNITSTTLTPGSAVTFGPDPANSNIGQTYPMMGVPAVGPFSNGSMSMFQDPTQVGQHVHGGTPNTQGGLFISGAPDAGRGANTDSPSGVFKYTIPAFGPFPATGANNPRSMYSLPYNQGVTFCIKF